MEFEVKENVLLAPYTTLKIGGSADKCVAVSSKEQLRAVHNYVCENTETLVVLGGGSNVLIADEGVRGCVVLMRILGIESVEKDGVVYLKAGAGELLDDVVAYAVARGWWGIENLSHIPGTVGATPIQNVGAYGVEVSDVIHEVEVFDREKGNFCILAPSLCDFGYRDSFFKKAEGRKFIITHVTFVLSAIPNPRTEYKDLATRFPQQSDPALIDIRNEIISIRSEKFPDWNTVGTAGSFFKNPVVSKEKADALCLAYPALPQYPTESGEVKISLGYVLDKILTLKGHTEGNVRLYEKQALVLVTERGALSSEVKAFAEKIIAQVKEKIGVIVEMEVTEIV